MPAVSSEVHMNKNKYFTLLKYVLESYFRAFILCIPFTLILYIVLKVTGIYSLLDLKYDSPLISMPIFVSLALSVIVFVFGIILYVFKYKRNSRKTEFYKSVSVLLEEKNKKEINN